MEDLSQIIWTHIRYMIYPCSPHEGPVRLSLIRLEIGELKKKEALLKEMLDESSILDEDPTATCLLMKKEILELNSHIDIVKNRNHFLQGRFQFYQFILVICR